MPAALQYAAGAGHIRRRYGRLHDRGDPHDHRRRHPRLDRAGRATRGDLRARLCGEFAGAHHAHRARRPAAVAPRIDVVLRAVQPAGRYGAQLPQPRRGPRAARVRCGLVHPERQRARGGACPRGTARTSHRRRQRRADGGDRAGRADRRVRGRSAWLAHDVRGRGRAFGHRHGRPYPWTAARGRRGDRLDVVAGPCANRPPSRRRAHRRRHHGVGERIVRGLHLHRSVTPERDTTARRSRLAWRCSRGGSRRASD